MCGIVGIYAYHYAALDVGREELRRIRANPRVKEVLDTFRGRIENVRREE